MEQRTLCLTIRMNHDSFELDLYEPESGECNQMQHPLSFDEHPEFDRAIGNEIYSWLELWRDAKGAEDENRQV